MYTSNYLNYHFNHHIHRTIPVLLKIYVVSYFCPQLILHYYHWYPSRHGIYSYRVHTVLYPHKLWVPTPMVTLFKRRICHFIQNFTFLIFFFLRVIFNLPQQLFPIITHSISLNPMITMLQLLIPLQYSLLYHTRLLLYPKKPKVLSLFCIFFYFFLWFIHCLNFLIFW
jgi:hypothetical protein